MQPPIICSGVICLDMLLESCEIPKTLESVTPFGCISYNPGGSAAQTALSLRRLQLSTYISGVIADDPHGRTLLSALQESGVNTTILTIIPITEQTDTSQSQTALAILPVFKDGRRGCFVNLGANNIAVPKQLFPSTEISKKLRVFHFGYPHLMPFLRGSPLRELFTYVRENAPHACITLDLNGADVCEDETQVITPALPLVTAVHANLEEACIITGRADANDTDNMKPEQVHSICEWFTGHGAGMVFITCGKDGVFGRSVLEGTPSSAMSGLRTRIVGEKQIYRPAYKISGSRPVNANGAGDAFMAGIVAELVKIGDGEENTHVSLVERLADSGLASALLRIDSDLLEANDKSMSLDRLLEKVKGRERIEPRMSFKSCYEKAIEHIEKD